MATGNAVWGIEVGQCALKAVKLRPTGEEDKVELAGFDLIEHPKILSQPDADPDELIGAALEKFVSRNDWQGDSFVMGVPGQQTFARFCKLPPVEARRIPDIVRFEASQQIPFDMDDVVWDYQVFQNEDLPDLEVGIFAMRRDLIQKHLDYFSSVGIAPRIIQTIPSALYNFCRYEYGTEIEEGTATIIVDVGAQHTDLIVVEANSAWSRNIPLGGNSFTEALVKAFKLTFAKAETLKRTAATSKYARQIFQAMRPVFADLVAEIQRSVGFYSSTHREVEIKRVLACGNAFHLPGLQKYLENNLTIGGGVQKLEKFEAMITSATANAPQFTENILSFGPAYGLALQGLGLSTISASLLPPELARVQMWKRKRLYFVASAACLAVAAAFPYMRSTMDQQALAQNDDLVRETKRIVDRAKQFQSEFQQVSGDTSGELAKIERFFELQKKRALVPQILAMVHEALPKIDPALAAASTPEELKKIIKSDSTRFARPKRNQIVIEKLELTFSNAIDAHAADSTAPKRAAASPSGSGGGGRMAMSGGGRMLGGGPTEVEAIDKGGDGEPGFYVHMEGRLLAGTDRPTAVRLIEEQLYPTLQRLGNVPGRGFYIPEKDPMNTADRNNENLREPYIVQFGGFTPVMGAAAAPLGAQPPGATGEPGEEYIAFPDPVTGEDMATDYRFALGFKIKLGEPPAVEGEAETTSE